MRRRRDYCPNEMTPMRQNVPLFSVRKMPHEPSVSLCFRWPRPQESKVDVTTDAAPAAAAASAAPADTAPPRPVVIAIVVIVVCRLVVAALSLESSLLSLHCRFDLRGGWDEWRVHVKRRRSRGLRQPPLLCRHESYYRFHHAHVPSYPFSTFPFPPLPPLSLSLCRRVSPPPFRDRRRGSIDPFGRRGSIGQGGFPQLGRPMCER